MADLMLKVNGDSSGAAAALQQAGGAVEDLGDDVGKSVVKWQELANITKKAVELVVKFGIDAVKAYAESERVQKQLTRAAGEYAEVLGEQAEAMSKVYAVDDDIIKQSQILLTQWGGVGAATEETTKAILNYAAATGQDAVSATQDLIRNVESGGVGLRKMGVDFKETGDRGKDLTAAVAALNSKFGGAAAANADTLTGSLHLASMAFDDLKKDLGESITKFLSETGAVNGLTQALRNMREFITGKERDALINEGLRQAAIINAKKELAYAEEELNAAMMEGQSQTILELFSADVINAQAKLDKLIGATKKLELPGAESVTGLTNKGGKDRQAAVAAARAEAEEFEKIRQKNIDDMRREQKEIDELDAHAADRDKKAAEAQQKALDEQQKRMLEHARETGDLLQKEMEATNQKLSDTFVGFFNDQREDFEKVKGQWEQAGAAIGAALVTSIASQLERLAAGEDLDAGEVIAEVLATVLAVAGSAIGSIYGGPTGGQIGGAIGSLAGAGVKAAARAGKRPKTMHSGGWVGDEATLPRYHSGAWIGADEHPAILQTGERVLSRTEVARMGGQGGVDSAARGRGGVSVFINAIDSKSAADSFASDLGRGMRLALQRGQGDLPALLGAGPR